MTHSSVHASLNGSRLVRFLADLSVSDVELSHKHFAQRLGRLIDLTDSIALSAAHGKLPVAGGQSCSQSDLISASEVLKDEFLRVRSSAVTFIAKSFIPGMEAAWLTLPVVTGDAESQGKISYEPYLRFYTTHQREIAFKVKRLRTNARQALAELSPRLAQLSALDTALEKTLAVHSRKLFLKVPVLLEKRFNTLRQQHQQALGAQDDDPHLWLRPGGWLETFYGEMQGLLLAELEERLQPVLGLIEALDDTFTGALIEKADGKL